MGSLWIMVLVVILTNGDVKTELQWPLKPEYNSEASCNKNAELKANELLVKLGSNNARVFFQCQAVNVEDLAKMVKKPGVDL